MSQPKIVCVIPSIRPECHAKFVKAWTPLFEKHKVMLVTVWDGEEPIVEINGLRWTASHLFSPSSRVPVERSWDQIRNLFYQFTDSCRNIGFVLAAQLMSSPDDVLITLDDDVEPCHHVNQWVPAGHDPIQAHIDALSRRAPISWMNTAHDTDLYLRGVPYGVRDESPVMLSHGVWVGVPDFDGETQLKLESEGEIPYALPYYVGPIPRGVNFCCCGMNLAVKRDAIPYLYFAPMGKDTGLDLHRFSDIWCGIFLKRKFDEFGWACVTGYSTIHHTRASDAKKNFEQEKLGRGWNEWITNRLPIDHPDTAFTDYFKSYAEKRERYAALIESILKGGKS